MEFNWSVDHDLWVLEQYAAFKKGKDIRDEFMVEFKDALKDDIEVLGVERVRNYINERIRILSPNAKKFPKKYREQFRVLRQQWTEKAKEVKGYHRTARLETLNTLLEEILSRPIDEGEKPQFTYKDKILLALKTIAEMRLEGDKSQLHLKSDIQHQPNVFEDEVINMFKNFSEDQMDEIRKLQDAGKPIQPLIERFIRDNLNHERSGGTSLTNGLQSGGYAP